MIVQSTGRLVPPQGKAVEDPNHLLFPLIDKLGSRSLLSALDRSALFSLPYQEGTLQRGDYVTYEGNEVDSCCVLLTGVLSRQKLTGFGAKQILSLHLRGDIIDLQNALVEVADHSVQAVTLAKVVHIRREALLRAADERPAIARALLVDTIVDCSIAREWLLSAGQRNAHQRISHLLCELVVRERDAGLRSEHGWDMPLTQEQLGEATGMTSVHVNRVLQRMRREGFVRLEAQKLVILDWAGLQAAGDFTDTYLHRRIPVALQGICRSGPVGG